MVDPAQEPAGDFDIVVQSQSGPRADRVATFNGLITAMRLATTAVSLLLVSTSDDVGLSLRIWTAIIVAYALVRAFRPLTYSNDVASLVRVLAEVALHVVAVAATGAWDSPFVFTLLTAVTVAGLARGFGFSIRVAIATVVAITFPFVLQATDRREATDPVGLLVRDRPARRDRRRLLAADLRRGGPRTGTRASTGSAVWPMPTRCCSHCTASHRRCPPRSTWATCSTRR